MTEPAQPACLFYDGSCALCNAEMQRLERLSDGRLELQDIHSLTHPPGSSDRKALLETLHYVDATGEVKTGLSANVAAWQHTPYGWLWRILEWPLVRPVASRCYDLWAAWRYRRLYGDA